MTVAQPPEEPVTLFTEASGTLPLALIMTRVYPHTRWTRQKGTNQVRPQRVWVVPEQGPEQIVRTNFPSYALAHEHALSVLFRKLVKYS